MIEAGEAKIAYDVLLNEACPGWMYQIKCGATTTWERWDAIKPDGRVECVEAGEYQFGDVYE